MDSGEIVISAEALIRISVFLLYAPVGLIIYWQLIPRLSMTAKRLAIAMLLAQVLVIAISLEFRPSSSYEFWLWHLDREWNIPSTFASTQLALVGGVALAAAWLARTRPVHFRFYLIVIGIVFLVLARDEYANLHEENLILEVIYIAIGAAIAVATLVLSARSPRRTWIWHICLLAGMATYVIGAMGVDELTITCDRLGSFQLDGCLHFYILEEVFEILGVWLTLVALLGHFSDAPLPPTGRVRLTLYAVPALWLSFLFLASLSARLELRFLSQPAAVHFDSGVLLRGYRIDKGEKSALVRLYTSASQWEYAGQRYSVKLIDQVSGGKSAATSDNWADHQFGFWLFGPGYVPVYLEWIDVVFPPDTPVNRAYWIVLTLWQNDNDHFIQQSITMSDHRLLSEKQLILGELVLPAESATIQGELLAEFDNGFTLEAVDLPERAQAGEMLTIPFSWRSGIDSTEDHSQFLHFGLEGTDTWWGHDQQPLGARLPTLLWYKGLAESEIWQVPLPADLVPGRYKVYTGLYRNSDKERVSASDADGRPFPDARVPLGSLIIE